MICIECHLEFPSLHYFECNDSRMPCNKCFANNEIKSETISLMLKNINKIKNTERFFNALNNDKMIINNIFNKFINQYLKIRENEYKKSHGFIDNIEIQIIDDEMHFSFNTYGFGGTILYLLFGFFVFIGGFNNPFLFFMCIPFGIFIFRSLDSLKFKKIILNININKNLFILTKVFRFKKYFSSLIDKNIVYLFNNVEYFEIIEKIGEYGGYKRYKLYFKPQNNKNKDIGYIYSNEHAIHMVEFLNAIIESKN